jgi:hypothetical protein
MKTPTASVACQKNKKRGKIPASLEELQNARDAGKKGFLMAKGTTSKYNSSVTAARAFLKVVCDGKKAGVSLNNPAGLDIDISLYAHAFDNTPNKYSSDALEMFITHKCFSEGCKESTATGTHAALAKLWDQS